MKDFAVSVIMQKFAPGEILYNHALAVRPAETQQQAMDDYVQKQREHHPESEGWKVLSVIGQEL